MLRKNKEPKKKISEMDIIERQAVITRRMNVFSTIFVITIIALNLVGAFVPVFADDAATTVQDILKKMIGYIILAFQAVGVVLSVYSVGQLMLAFKNEDADSKSRASTQLVVGVILIAIKPLITSLNLVDKITGGYDGE